MIWKCHLQKNDKEKADTLASYFRSVFTTEPDDDSPTIPCRANVPMGTLKITPEIVRKKLVNLNTSKSPGPDKLHPRFLYELSYELSLPLSILFNKSLSLGTLPQCLLNANIICY
jgi:hypothetical protein